MYTNSIFLLDNKNNGEIIYVVKRFTNNKYTRGLKRFALVFDFETSLVKELNLGIIFHFFYIFWFLRE